MAFLFLSVLQREKGSLSEGGQLRELLLSTLSSLRFKTDAHLSIHQYMKITSNARKKDDLRNLPYK